MQQALAMTLLRGFEVPLLYRWKYFDVAAEYVLRNLALHGVLKVVWERCMQDGGSDLQDPAEFAPLDEDDADLPLSLKERVRLSKVQEMLAHPNAVANFAKILIATTPLSAFMDRASLMETMRLRMRLRRQGVELASSKVTTTQAEFAAQNLEMVSTEAGWDVVKDMFELITASETDELHDLFNVSLDDTTLPMVSGICDAWRRLIMAYQCLPWRFLQIVRMDSDTGLPFIRKLRAEVQGCDLCKDQFFSEVLMDFVLNGDEGGLAERFKKVRQLVEDVLCELPASSVEVEKGHANVQVDFSTGKQAIPKKPSTVQQDSYCLSAILEHQALKSAVEEDVLGSAKSKVHRVLAKRTLSSTAPWLKAGRKTATTKEAGKRLAPLSALLSIREGKVRKDFAKTRRVSAYNAFQAQRREEGQRWQVGSEEFKKQNQAWAEAWRIMSQEERVVYEDKAAEMNRARDEVKRVSLNASSSYENELSKAQLQRLNNARLDTTLTKVATHGAWDRGLGLSDHIAALRGSLVDTNMEKAMLKDLWTSAFAYDSQIIANPSDATRFRRSCVSQNGGLCVNDRHFSHVSQLVVQFDALLEAHKLGGSPVAVHFVYNVRRWTTKLGDKSCPTPGTYALLGCVCKKPKCQVLMQLYPASRYCLNFHVQDFLPKIYTAHQMFSMHLKAHEGNQQELSNFGLEVRFYCDLKRIGTADSHGFSVDLDEPSHCHQIGQGFDTSLKPPPAVRAGGKHLPFGLDDLIKAPKKPEQKRAKRDVGQKGAGKATGNFEDTSATTTAAEARDRDRDLNVLNEQPIELARQAEEEMRHAVAADEASKRLQEDLGDDAESGTAHAGDDSAAAASSSSSRPGPTSQPASAQVGGVPEPKAKPKPSSAPTSFFYRSVGIQDIGRAKRAGMVCYHCGGSIPKGEWKFGYAYNVKKPARSIHPTCLAQMPAEAAQPSLAQLASLSLAEGDAEARRVCGDARETLQCLAMSFQQ